MLNVNNQSELFMDAVLRNYGIETRKADRQYKPFIDVVRDLRNQWNELSESEQNALIKVLFVGWLKSGCLKVAKIAVLDTNKIIILLSEKDCLFTGILFYRSY